MGSQVFLDFGGENILVSRDLKMGTFTIKKLSKYFVLLFNNRLALEPEEVFFFSLIILLTSFCFKNNFARSCFIGQNLSVQCPQGLNILRYKDVEFPIHYENGKQALSLIMGQSRLTLN